MNDGFIEGWHKRWGHVTDKQVWMLINRCDLLEEDIWCVHKWLDDRGAPRKAPDGQVYSIVGRITKLMEKR